MILCASVNYLGLIHYTVLKPRVDLFSFFEIYQYLFQILYFFLFGLAWKVRNPRSYAKRIFQKQTLFLLTFQGFCNYFIYFHEFTAVLALNFILAMYWTQHVQILYAINSE